MIGTLQRFIVFKGWTTLFKGTLGEGVATNKRYPTLGDLLIRDIWFTVSPEEISRTRRAPNGLDLSIADASARAGRTACHEYPHPELPDSTL